MNQTLLSENIKKLSVIHGIDVMGFADASEFKNYAIKDSIRKDPKLSLSDAKTIIVAGVYIGGVTLPKWSNQLYGRTSRLYLSEFFLDVVKPLEPIVKFLKGLGYHAISCNSYHNEHSILPLKLAAIRAGIGWQGKHSLIISKKHGTFLALGGIITNADLDHNTIEERNRCGNCNKCQIACPMGALDQAHLLDRSKCISNLLQNDFLPLETQNVLENRVGDCEICQDGCP